MIILHVTCVLCELEHIYIYLCTQCIRYDIPGCVSIISICGDKFGALGSWAGVIKEGVILEWYSES